jgi:hypothetical protein
MGKFEEITGGFPETGGEWEYAKEIKVTTNVPNVFRLVDGKDSLISYNISWIMCDDNVIRPFIIKNEHEGISILGRMFGDKKNFYNGGYFETKKTKFGATPTYQAKDPELYKIMTEYWNDSYQGTGSAKPKDEWMYNAIQRTPEIVDNQNVYWCMANKHTKIIKLGQKALTALKAVMENDGPKVEEYDINYIKQGAGSKTVHSMLKAGPGVAHAVAGELSVDEKQYMKYDLKEVTRLSSAYYCLKHIPNKIKRMDVAMGTNYYQEMEKQASIEQELWEKNKDNKTAMQVTPPMQAPIDNPFNDNNIPFEASKAPVTPPVSSGRRLVTPSTTPAVPANTKMIPCPTCAVLIPEDSIICPKCGDKLLEPCSVCNNLFSTKATVCPHCGAVYQ